MSCWTRRARATFPGYTRRHLPRIKLLARRLGREAFTVPATEERRIRGTPWFLAREVAAFWWYHACGLGR
jgi:hypothetical protein